MEANSLYLQIFDAKNGKIHYQYKYVSNISYDCNKCKFEIMRERKKEIIDNIKE